MTATLIFSFWPTGFAGWIYLFIRVIVLLVFIPLVLHRAKYDLWIKAKEWQGPTPNFLLLLGHLLIIAWAVAGWWLLLFLLPLLSVAVERRRRKMKSMQQELDGRNQRLWDFLRKEDGYPDYTDEQWAARRGNLALMRADKAMGRAMSDEEVTDWRQDELAKEKAAAAQQKAAKDHRAAAPAFTKAARNGKPARRAVVLELAEPLVVENAEGSSPQVLSGIVPGHVEMLRHWPEEKGHPTPPLFIVGVTIPADGQTIVTGGITDVSGLFRPEHFTQASWWADAPEQLRQEDAAGAIFGPVWISGPELTERWQGEVGGRKIELLPGKREHGFALSIRPDGKTLLCRIFGLLANPDDATSCLPPFYFELPLVVLLQAPRVERRTAEVNEDGTINYSEPL